MHKKDVCRLCLKYSSGRGQVKIVYDGFHRALNPLSMVSAVIENEKNEILLVKWQEEHEEGWDLPGGFLSGNQDFRGYIKKYIKEILNLDIDTDRVLHTGQDQYTHLGIINPTVNTFVSCVLFGSVVIPGKVISEWKFFPRHTVLNRVFSRRHTGLAIKAYFKLSLSHEIKQIED